MHVLKLIPIRIRGNDAEKMRIRPIPIRIRTQLWKCKKFNFCKLTFGHCLKVYRTSQEMKSLAY
jgi:hypothetical protein